MASWEQWEDFLGRNNIRATVMRPAEITRRGGETVRGHIVRFQHNDDATTTFVPEGGYEHLDERMFGVLLGLNLDPEDMFDRTAGSIIRAAKAGAATERGMQLAKELKSLSENFKIPDGEFSELVQSLENQEDLVHKGIIGDRQRFDRTQVEKFVRDNKLDLSARYPSTRNNEETELTFIRPGVPGRHGTEDVSITVRTDSQAMLWSRQLANVVYKLDAHEGVTDLMGDSWQEEFPERPDPNRLPLDDDPNREREDDRRDDRQHGK